MKTIAQLIAQARQSLADKLAKRDEHNTEVEQIRAKMLEEQRDVASDEEAVKIREAQDAKRKLDNEIKEIQERITALEDEQARDEAANRLQREVHAGAKPPKYGEGVGREERTYRPDNGVNGNPSFFRDFYASVERQNSDARARLDRHMVEERADAEKTGKQFRAIGTGTVGGLVVPNYLTEEFAPILRNGRPLANACASKELPEEGMTVIVPRGSTGSSAAAQASQNAAVSNTDVNFNNDLTVNVQTYSGEQDVARQILERGTSGIDQLIYEDLVSAYGTALDVDIINGAGTSGTHKGVLNASGTNSVTFTSASPTVVLAWSKLANAKGLIGANRKMPANLWVMTTTRWAWFVAALDGNNRPLLIDNPSAAINAMGVSNAENFGEGQLVGTLQGIPVLCDDNIPANLGAGTNQDDIICVRRQDLYLWEEGDGMPRELRFEQTKGNNLTVVLVVYGYSAFTAERYAKAVSIVSGTGLVAPTF